MFVEDDNGELFYVHGNIDERATVNDDDQPFVTSTIRRNLPAMDEVEFERLDQLSNGRLRHLMLGSPSGYMWSDQVERILAHEHRLDLKDGRPTDPKMLPLKERVRRFRELLGVDPDTLVPSLDTQHTALLQQPAQEDAPPSEARAEERAN